MAGNALPTAFDKNPCVGKAPHVLVWFALVGAPGAVRSDDNCTVRVHADFNVLNRQSRQIELRIFDVGEKLVLFYQHHWL